MCIVSKENLLSELAACEPPDGATLPDASRWSWYSASPRQLARELAALPASYWRDAAANLRQSVLATQPEVFGLVAASGRRDRGRRPSANGARAARGVYLPVGLLAHLPEYPQESLRLASIDLCNRLSRGDRQKWRGIRARRLKGSKQRGHTARERYGRAPRQHDGSRPWVWDLIGLHLRWLGVLEVRETKDGRPYFRPGTKSLSYRLRRRWREVVGVQRIEVPTVAADVVDHVDVDSLRVPSWYLSSLDRVRFDLEGGLVQLAATYGAVAPGTLDFDDWQDAFAEAVPPEELLEAIAAKKKRGDRRDPIEIARNKALSRLVHLWRWRVDGECYARRDAAGHRLHSPLTSLAGELRRFVSFDGVSEELVSIDAANSQMVILAAMAIRDLPNAPDAREFLEITAAGQFYEGAFMAANGCDPTKEERKAFKSEVMACWLYSERHKQTSNTVGKALAAAWPQLDKWFHQRKITASTLPCEAQRREAAIWVDQLAVELEALGVPAVSVHDSVLVPWSRADDVLAVLMRLYAEAGLRATFRVEAV